MDSISRPNASSSVELAVILHYGQSNAIQLACKLQMLTCGYVPRSSLDHSVKLEVICDCSSEPAAGIEDSCARSRFDGITVSYVAC